MYICTIKLIGHPVFNCDLDKEHCQRQWLVVLVSERDVAEAWTDVVDGETALANQLTVVIEHGHSQEG